MAAILLVLVTMDGYCHPQDEATIFLNQNTFVVKTIAINHADEGTSETLLKLYRKERDGNGEKYLLQHVLKNDGGDHNSQATELGDYLINGTAIIFYSYWMKGGDAPGSPCGVRKQVYSVARDGKLILTEGSIYYEDGTMGPYNSLTDNASALLQKKELDEQEKKNLIKYKNLVEKDLNASFITGKDAVALKKEIHDHFKDAIREFVDYWSGSLDGSSFGYCAF